MRADLATERIGRQHHATKIYVLVNVDIILALGYLELRFVMERVSFQAMVSAGPAERIQMSRAGALPQI